MLKLISMKKLPIISIAFVLSISLFGQVHSDQDILNDILKQLDKMGIE